MTKFLYIQIAVFMLAASYAASGQEMTESRMRRTGGYVYKHNGEAKKLVFAVSPDIEDLSPVSNTSKEIEKSLSIQVDVIKLKVNFTLATAQDVCNEISEGAVVYVINDRSLPTILTVPEANWGVLNLHSLKSTETQENIYYSRVSKELWRTFAYVCGVADCSDENCLMQPVFDLTDLDKMRSRTISIEAFMRMSLRMKRLKIQTSKRTTYREACIEGWAPAPTNDIQRAIWERVHSIPDKPLKIEFDPATQKGKVTK